MPVRVFIFLLTIVSIFLLPQLSLVQVWDLGTVNYFSQHRTPTGIQVFKWITQVGSTWGFLIIFFLTILYFWVKRRWRTGVFYLIGVGLLKLSVSGLKVWVGRPRPEVALYDLPTLSMPSGHAANAVLMYGILAIYCLQKVKPPILRALAFGFFLALLLATDFSRVYLGVHYPSDVLMGSLYTASGLWLLQGVKKDMLSFW